MFKKQKNLDKNNTKRQIDETVQPSTPKKTGKRHFVGQKQFNDPIAHQVVLLRRLGLRWNVNGTAGIGISEFFFVFKSFIL